MLSVTNLTAASPQTVTLRGGFITAGDYAGLGQADLAIFRPSTGFWYIDSSLNPSSPVVAHWGTANDIPVVGDFDGDGKDDIAV
jgi:hypothetical protein